MTPLFIAACDCDPAGITDEEGVCDSRGQCSCKANVESATCGECQDGYFNMTASNPDGCQCECVCGGKGKDVRVGEGIREGVGRGWGGAVGGGGEGLWEGVGRGCGRGWRGAVGGGGGDGGGIKREWGKDSGSWYLAVRNIMNRTGHFLFHASWNLIGIQNLVIPLATILWSLLVANCMVIN